MRKRAAFALLWLVGAGACVPDTAPLLPPEVYGDADPAGARLVVRIVHVTDSHAVDSLSPARFAGAHALSPFAWRAWENCSTQILDGIVRAANRIHASGERVGFLLHTGDACDNAQDNERRWFLAVMDGGEVNPLSGPDDRPGDARPPPDRDPYAPFRAQGLYRQGVHGDAPSIPWYMAIGNHDVYALGVFPIVERNNGSRVAPLPLSGRPGWLLPTVFDPTGAWTHGLITPANPGPPPLLDWPTYVTPSAERRYSGRGEFVAGLFETTTGPAGHGFNSAGGPPWYSVSPVAGVRLIVLYTSDRPDEVPGLIYSEGALSAGQREFLEAELRASLERGELAVVASHHPSRMLDVLSGSQIGPHDLRETLNRYPNVVLHLAGHDHRNRVADRGGYVEIETCSTIDPPNEARVVEIWRDEADGSLLVSYRMFSGLDETRPPLGDDPLRPLREAATAMAAGAKDNSALARGIEPVDGNAAGGPADRAGVIRLHRPAPAD